MTRENNNRYILIALMLFMSTIISAQKWTTLPGSFKHTQRNGLIGGEYLDSILIRIADSANVKIMMIGDSHVKGKAFPQAVERTLRTAMSHIGWTFHGINGACASRFCDHDMISRIAAEKPDIVIICFGTNESHAPNYSETVHSQELMSLVCRIEGINPRAKIILTTPPGSYIRERAGRRVVRGRRRAAYNHTRNEKTGRVAKNIVDFARAQHIACWDVFNIAGGDFYAASNWRDSGLMQTDYIHYTVDGYNLMGKLLGEAIIRDYYERVAH